MSEHFCCFTIKWATNQDEKSIRCDKPASLKRDSGFWLCAEHFDIIEEAITIIRDGIGKSLKYAD